MTNDFAVAMRRALEHVRANDPTAATRVIQAAWSAAKADSGAPLPPASAPSSAGQDEKESDGRRIRRPLSKVISLLRGGRQSMAAEIVDSLQRKGLSDTPPAIREGAQFLASNFVCSAGSRAYKLYIPAELKGGPRGLVVMLHGCTQNPDDFAAGTGMNEFAETYGLVIAYPEQTAQANPSACWNWFRPTDQQRGSGEPAIIAELTRSIARQYSIDRDGTFVAGLSAGGAMAAILAETYPDVFGAIGVHSGLANGSAKDIASAFAAMRGDLAGVSRSKAPDASSTAAVRTIIFHGTSDRTVHDSNGTRIFDAAQAPLASTGLRKEQQIGNIGGRNYSRTSLSNKDGRLLLVSWSIEGLAHAWSGGRTAGSYTDPAGPDASAEMLRFFLETEPAGAL